MKISISLVGQAPVGRTHLSGSRSVQAPPLDYKRESALVRRIHLNIHLKLRFNPGFHNQYSIQVGVGYYAPAVRTTLKSLCLSCVHPSIDQALLGLPQILP
jgi:hypothetical protein